MSCAVGANRDDGAGSELACCPLVQIAVHEPAGEIQVGND
jgi:hypothetical protein